MLKMKKKFLIVILGFLVALCLFNTNSVKATTEEDLQTILDLVPDEMYLDISEIEFEEADELIEQQIYDIFNENNIDLGDYNLTVRHLVVYGSFYQASISLSSLGYVEKSIEIVFNNTGNLDSEDEQYIKSIEIENPYYFEVDLDELFNMITNANTYIEEYYTKKINDSSLTIKAVFYGAGTVGDLNWKIYEDYGIYLLIFKNNKLYEVRHIEQALLIPVINVPSSISDDEMNDYILEKVEETNSDYVSLIKSIEKGLTDIQKVGKNINYNNIVSDLDNIYTLNTGDSQSSWIIINREKSSIQIKDETTNVILYTDTTVLPSDTQLIVTEITTGDSYNTVTTALENITNKFIVYDITLISNNVIIQPDGNVKISIPIPDDFSTSNLVVYRVEDDGSKTRYEVTVEEIDGIQYAIFETDHFSIYVLADESTSITTEDTTVGENETELSEDEKDDTPKTGTKNVIDNFIVAIVLVAIIVLVVKKYNK